MEDVRCVRCVRCVRWVRYGRCVRCVRCLRCVRCVRRVRCVRCERCVRGVIYLFIYSLFMVSGIHKIAKKLIKAFWTNKIDIPSFHMLLFA